MGIWLRLTFQDPRETGPWLQVQTKWTLKSIHMVCSGDKPVYELPKTFLVLTNRLKETASCVTTYDIFSQLLGIALRWDIPLALDLLPCFWKSLLSLPLDPHDDLRETRYSHLQLPTALLRGGMQPYCCSKVVLRPCLRLSKCENFLENVYRGRIHDTARFLTQRCVLEFLKFFVAQNQL